MKRGMLVLKPLLEIVIGMSVVFSLFSISRTLGDQDFYVHYQIAEESALAVDQFAGIQGNVYIKNPRESKYPTALAEKEFIVAHPAGKDGKITIPFASGNKIIQNDASSGYLYKNGNDISLSDNVPELNLVPCDEPKKFLRPILKVTEETKEIAVARGMRCVDNVCWREGASPPTNADIIIEVNPSDEGVTAQYANEASKTAACTIVNKILSDNTNTATWTLPTNKVIHTENQAALLIEVDPTQKEALKRALREVIG